MSKANEWDGIGPRLDCLLLVRWIDASQAWAEFAWSDADEGHAGGYDSELAGISADIEHDPGSKYHGQCVPNEHFEILAWADLPDGLAE